MTCRKCVNIMVFPHSVFVFWSSQKKKGKDHCNKENTLARKSAALDSSNSNFGLAEDSNTCKY